MAGRASSTREALRDAGHLIGPHARRHKALFIAALAAMLTGTLVALPIPLLHRFLVDRVLLGGQGHWLPYVLGVYAAAGTAMLGLSMGQQYLFARFQQAAMLDLQGGLFERVFRLPKLFLDRHETGYLEARLAGDTQGAGWFLSAAPAAWTGNIARLAGNTALLFILEWRLAIVAVLVLPLVAWSSEFVGRRMRNLNRHGMEMNAQFQGALQESLSNVTLIKTHGAEQRAARGLTDRLRGIYDLGLEQMTVGAVGSNAVGLTPRLAQFGVLAAGAWMILHGSWTLGSLAAFQAALAGAFGPVHQLVNAHFSMHRALAAVERVQALAAIAPEPNAGVGRRVEQLAGEVEFRGVSFAYDPATPVLDDVSFRIRPGEHVAIAGASGVGKSTLVGLLLRFYQPSSGEVLYDGVPAGEYELGSLRRRLGYVAQTPMLLKGTLIDTLRFGNEQAAMDSIEQALEASQMADFVRGLPEGLRTRLDERGANLSEGQKQRLALARALVADPDILVLDEFSAPLDAGVEESVFSVLLRLRPQRTILVVSHRAATLARADRVLWLAHGRIENREPTA